MDDLINGVQLAFTTLRSETLDNVFRTLQGCKELMMKSNGEATTRFHTQNKSRLKQQSEMSFSIPCGSLSSSKIFQFLG